jgi:hypothetical protein
MYLDSLVVSNFRVIERTHVEFVHPDRAPGGSLGPKPAIPNVTLLLGDNGAGKSTLIKAVAMAALGPAFVAARLPCDYLVRRGGEDAATVKAKFITHEQDVQSGSPTGILNSEVEVVRRGDVEMPLSIDMDGTAWAPIFSATADAFFVVGYGTTRRVESRDRFDPGARAAASFQRAQRVRGLFEDSYSLVPLSVWLPELTSRNPGRFTQVRHLLNKLLEGTDCEFIGERELGEYLFASNGAAVPFPALSDGYRGYLGWIADLLYHVCETCPKGKKLVDNHGIVLIDEIDLLLHPRWQIRVLPILAKALPNLQFIVTSHSPLVVGSLEWMNLRVMHVDPEHGATADTVREPVHGLDADQVLLTEYFGLSTTRASDYSARLQALSEAAAKGDPAAALALARALSHGSEPGE